MNNNVKLSSILVGAFLSQLNANEVDSVKDIFEKATISGQVRLAHYSLNPDTDKTKSVTALGGQLKFETAQLNGINAGIAIYTSQSIEALSGEQNDGRFSDYLTSSEKSYTELAEAYLNYTTKSFNIRVGRQSIDTPLADSDDVYMTPNTFEAVFITYNLKDLGLSILGANIQRMQGGDANYTNVINDSWMDTGDNGTNMLAFLYANDALEVGIWYYHIDKSTKAMYMDASANFEISKNNGLSLYVQYLDENEENGSDVDGSIAGVMLEVSLDRLTTSIAYNSVNIDTTKTIFEGFGGGCSYTNMQTTTAGSLGVDSSSYMLSLNYDIESINLFTSYGEFEADKTSEAHITELDIGASYAFNEEFDISLVYIDVDDKLVANSGADEVKLFANYNF